MNRSHLPFNFRLRDVEEARNSSADAEREAGFSISPRENSMIYDYWNTIHSARHTRRHKMVPPKCRWEGRKRKFGGRYKGGKKKLGDGNKKARRWRGIRETKKHSKETYCLYLPRSSTLPPWKLKRATRKDLSNISHFSDERHWHADRNCLFKSPRHYVKFREIIVQILQKFSLIFHLTLLQLF